MNKNPAKLPDYKVLAKTQILSEKAGYQISLMNIPKMWEVTKGAGVKVAVIDTGRPDHPEIDVTDSMSARGFSVSDGNGHGTHVAGIIKAKCNNGIGIQGIAPECELYTANVLGPKGSGSIESVIEGIKWAISKKVDVINMSLGVTAKLPILPLKNVLDEAKAQGITIICAAGNENGPVSQPASYSCAIAVAAIDKNERRAYFSNKGSELDFCTPGVDIFSTYLNKGYALLSGTSMASPVLAGVAALIIAKHKAEGVILKPDEVKEHISRICFDLGLPGDDSFYGIGMPIFNYTPPEHKSIWTRIWSIFK